LLLQPTTPIEGTVLAKPTVHAAPYTLDSHVNPLVEILLVSVFINTLNAELKPICHLLALLGAHHILHVSRIRVNIHKRQADHLEDPDEDEGILKCICKKWEREHGLD